MGSLLYFIRGEFRFIIDDNVVRGFRVALESSMSLEIKIEVKAEGEQCIRIRSGDMDDSKHTH